MLCRYGKNIWSKSGLQGLKAIMALSQAPFQPFFSPLSPASVNKVPIRHQSKLLGKLNQDLEREIKYELENYVEVEDKETFLKETGFEQIEKEEEAKIVLKKQVGAKTVEVHFMARPPPFEEENNPEESNENPENEEEPMDEFLEFTVAIKDPNGKGLICEATSSQSEINIFSMFYSQNVDDDLKVNKFERSMRSYSGPEFSTLDERLQYSLMQYLKSLGVDEKLGTYVEMTSYDKDQRLYTQWLKDIKGFISN